MGEIARAAAIFEVDEIVVYDDLSVSRKGQGGVRDDSASIGAGGFNTASAKGGGGGGSGGGGGGGSDRNNPNIFMARLLQVRAVCQLGWFSHECLLSVCAIFFHLQQLLYCVLVHGSTKHPGSKETMCI